MPSYSPPRSHGLDSKPCASKQKFCEVFARARSVHVSKVITKLSLLRPRPTPPAALHGGRGGLLDGGGGKGPKARRRRQHGQHHRLCRRVLEQSDGKLQARFHDTKD